MTNEELQGHLEALDRAVSAGELQVRAVFTDEWHDASHGHRNTYFRLRDDGSYRFRIKPKPREVWMHILPDGRLIQPGYEIIPPMTKRVKFREVTEE
jgi:hypothetical protein